MFLSKHFKELSDNFESFHFKDRFSNIELLCKRDFLPSMQLFLAADQVAWVSEKMSMNSQGRVWE